MNLMKVFRYFDMPHDVKDEFLERYGDRIAHRDMYVEYNVYDMMFDDSPNHTGELIEKDPDSGLVQRRGLDIVSDWLVDNGAKRGEEVLIIT